MDRGAWQATVQGVAKSWMQLSDTAWQWVPGRIISKNVFIYSCAGSSLLCMAFSHCANKGHSWLWCMGFSQRCFPCSEVWALGTRASVIAARGFSS